MVEQLTQIRPVGSEGYVAMQNGKEVFIPRPGSFSFDLAQSSRRAEMWGFVGYAGLLAEAGAAVASNVVLFGGVLGALVFHNENIATGAVAGDIALLCCIPPLLIATGFMKKWAENKKARHIATQLKDLEVNPLPAKELKRSKHSTATAIVRTVRWTLRAAAITGIATGTGIAGTFIGGPGLGAVAAVGSAALTGSFIMSRVDTFQEGKQQLQRSRTLFPQARRER